MKAIDLNRRVTLNTLKVLKIRTDLKALTAFPLPPDNKVNSSIDNETIAPSKMFILSLKYPIGPKAINFRPISAINMYVKIDPNISISDRDSASLKDPFIDKITVFPTTAPKIKLLRCFPFTISFNSLCLTAIQPVTPAKKITFSYPEVDNLDLILFALRIGKLSITSSALQ